MIDFLSAQCCIAFGSSFVWPLFCQWENMENVDHCSNFRSFWFGLSYAISSNGIHPAIHTCNQFSDDILLDILHTERKFSYSRKKNVKQVSILFGKPENCVCQNVVLLELHFHLQDKRSSRLKCKYLSVYVPSSLSSSAQCLPYMVGFWQPLLLCLFRSGFHQ